MNKLIRGEPGAAPKTVDVEYALSALRSENAHLKGCAKTNADRHAQNEETHRKNLESWKKESLRLQTELLASQERVFELQGKLLSLREIINSVSTAKE